MKGDTETDALLKGRFARLKGGDAQRAPDFAAMMARARREIDARASARVAAGEEPARSRPNDGHTVRIRPAEPPARSERAGRDSYARVANGHGRRPVLRWAVPLALAAGIAAIVVVPRLPDRAADREFDRLVTEWSRTTEATRHAPTDALLSLPGVGLLGNMPPIGSGVGALRGPS